VRVLAVNAGSSSLKYALFDLAGGEERCVVRDEGDIDAVARTAADAVPNVVAHRIVFGGPEHRGPALATPELVRQLRAFEPFDPLHLSVELDAVDAMTQAAPSAVQTLSFDTAFHRALPAVARALALATSEDPLLQRYGYHGLSYEYIVSALGERARGRVIVAHLGSGASMTALRYGSPVETTMGFSPLGGIVMGTRPGDLDPGAVLRLLAGYHGDAARLRDELFRHAGLLGVSGTTSDMRALIAAMDRDESAARAVGLFAFSARKAIGALAAALGGLDRLVFTGGIGEHAPRVRELICTGLEHLGIALNEPARSRVVVEVIATDEERVLARHAQALLAR
ncbi:MAG: acetate/propionate family kinase, partial [bacterium]|nr:acetate/propionate family kinase [bacterium]